MKHTPLLIALGLFALSTVAFSLYQINRYSSHTFAGTLLQEPKPIEGIRLIDHEGTPRDLADFRGNLALVFFGFTNCPDVCPLTMAQLTGIYEDLGEPEALKVLMITVDPERDTPERMAQYVKGFHPDFIGLTGSRSAVEQAASAFYIGHRHLDDGMVVHTDVVILLDRESRMRLIYNQDSLGELAEDLQYVLAQRSW